MDENETIRVKDLIQAMKANFPVLPADVLKQLVQDLLVTIQRELEAGHHVKLGVIGTLRVKAVPAHSKKHPKSGEDVVVPASKSVRLRMSKKFKESLREE